MGETSKRSDAEPPLSPRPPLFRFGPLLAAASGALYFAAFPQVDAGGFAFVALVPLLLAIAGGSRRRAFLLGWLTGTLAVNALTSPSIYEASRRYFGGDSLAAALLALVIPQVHGALYFGLFGALAHRWERLPPVLAGLVVPAAWVACEWARATIGWGAPWILLGHSQHDRLWIVQIADVTGVFGVSFVVAAANVMAAAALLRLRQPSRPVSAAGAVAVALLYVAVFVYGHLALARWSEPPSRSRVADARSSLAAPQSPRSLRLALVQPALDLFGRASLSLLPANLRRLEALTRMAADGDPDLVIWPENAVGFSLAANQALLAEAAAGLPGSSRLLVGAPREVDDAGQVHFRNAAFLVDPAGNVEATYDKLRLTPFAETTPWPLMPRQFAAADVYTAGDRLVLFEVHGARFATLICYEAIYPDLARQAVLAGAELLVNISNDDWFGGRAAMAQHFQASLFRAVETRRWLARATNSGITAVVAPSGALTAVAPPGEAATLAAPIGVEHELTLYARHGDVFAWICVATALGALAYALRCHSDCR